MISPLFICHGGPTLVLENNEYTNFLQDLGRRIKPKAIVIFSAHWESEITTISTVKESYDMIYDFYGFPEELYSIKYPAQGSTEVATKLQSLLENSGIPSRLNENRGLDHGSWVVLNIMYSKADIPVVQVSVNPNLSMEEQYKIGEAIRKLGDEDILVIGSGGTVHNLSTIDWNAQKTQAWAVEFDNWLIDKVVKNELQDLFEYRRLVPNAKRAVPREEHLVPLFISMGSGDKEKLPKLLYRSYEYGTLSYICFEF